jgi:hypothetical protein
MRQDAAATLLAIISVNTLYTPPLIASHTPQKEQISEKLLLFLESWADFVDYPSCVESATIVASHALKNKVGGKRHVQKPCLI